MVRFRIQENKTFAQSIKNIYSKYSDIDKVEYDSIISKLETSPIKYLTDKYHLIKDFYGIDKKISINDFIEQIDEWIININEDEIFNTNEALNIINSNLRIVKGSSHNVHLEKPDEFNKIVKKFLEKN